MPVLRNGRRLALQISVTVAGACCLYSLLCMVNDRQGGFDWIDAIPAEFHGSMWTAMLFGLLAAQSYQALQRVKWTDSHWQ